MTLHVRKMATPDPGDLPIPTIESLGTEDMVHRPSEREFSPPSVTNQWAMAQASRDVTAYDDFMAPPIRCGEGKHAELFIGTSKDDFKSCATLDLPVTYRWYPHAVIRKARFGDLEVSSHMSMATQSHALMLTLKVTNASDRRVQDLDLFLKTLLGVNASAARVAYDAAAHAYVCHDLTGAGAAAVQSVDVAPTGHGAYVDWEAWYHNAFYRQYNGWKDSEVATYGAFYYRISLDPGEFWEVRFVHALADSEAAARQDNERLRDGYEEAVARTAAEWSEEIRAAFTPGNGRFSGHLPLLQASDPDLQRLYDMSCMSLLLLKRTHRMGTPADVYATGMPGFGWTHCFLWDTQMSAEALSLLDPAALRRMVEFWLRHDPTNCFATDYVTGEPEGVWYAINDFALVYMITAYVRVTGDNAWLDTQVAGMDILAHVQRLATRFVPRADPQDHLVDFGDARNLLECVFSYAHKVPAFNATNVWMLRTAAQLMERCGRADGTARMRGLADDIARSVLGLYGPGSGYWQCRYPDGSLVGVRTCLDFNYVFLGMEGDLPQGVKDEMADFFVRELMTPTWMHALSPLDPDTASSMRTDHQDDGAFVSWPAFGLLVLLRAGRRDEALRWLGLGGRPGLAAVMRQGPWGQAYFHGGEGSPLEFGAAMKAPKEHPFIERYAVLAGAMYLTVVIQELLGVSIGWDGVREESPASPPTQADGGAVTVRAALRNLHVHGENFEAQWSAALDRPKEVHRR